MHRRLERTKIHIKTAAVAVENEDTKTQTRNRLNEGQTGFLFSGSWLISSTEISLSKVTCVPAIYPPFSWTYYQQWRPIYGTLILLTKIFVVRHKTSFHFRSRSRSGRCSRVRAYSDSEAENYQESSGPFRLPPTFTHRYFKLQSARCKSGR